jgi:hypothetical protein
MNLKKRFGSFFTTVGGVLVVLFFISDYVKQVEGWYLLLGVLFLGMGITLALQGRGEPEPSARFRLLRGGKRRDEDSDNQRDKKGF